MCVFPLDFSKLGLIIEEHEASFFVAVCAEGFACREPSTIVQIKSWKQLAVAVWVTKWMTMWQSPLPEASHKAPASPDIIMMEPASSAPPPPDVQNRLLLFTAFWEDGPRFKPAQIKWKTYLSGVSRQKVQCLILFLTRSVLWWPYACYNFLTLP